MADPLKFRPPKSSAERGGALLMVLWLSAALAAIAFSVAETVRGEMERTSTEVDGARAYYLAVGGLERALVRIGWGDSERGPDGRPRYWDWQNPVNIYEFPTGVAVVEMIPESSKLNINTAPPEEIQRLLLALGATPEQAAQITGGIVEFRSPGPAPPFALFAAGAVPTFPPPHASFQEIEEVLMVPGVTPELFYGTYERGPEGRLRPRPGLRHTLTTYGTNDGFDVNTVQPAVLLALGAPAEAVEQLALARARRPVRPEDLDSVRGMLGGAGGRIRLGGNMIFTLRSTARLRLPGGKLHELRRSVAALVRRNESGGQEACHILRWYDNAGGDGTLFDVWPQ